MKSVVFLAVAIFMGVCAGICGTGSRADISLVVDGQPGLAARHGLIRLTEVLTGKKVSVEKTNSLAQARGKTILVAGLATQNGTAANLLRKVNHPLPQGAEALVIRQIRWQGKPTWVIAGSDDRGLMYAELDVADRIARSTGGKALLSGLRDTDEKPDVSERALSIYTFNRAYWESRFYDEAYWEKYLDVLAQNRFNTLVVIFGYENGGFLAPCYPYFFDLPEFPGIRMVGITAAQQQRNLAALNRLVATAHSRGLKFTVGIWDHIYRGGVQGGGIPGADEATRRPIPGLVWGVTAENLTDYTKAALARFVKLVPEIDGIQFRMHDESGLKPSEQERFWRDVFQMMKEQSPNLRLDLRAKGLPDSVIQSALDTGIDFRITTKYWMEQMGLPFHPTHINTQNQFDRRHSYADLLRFPQRYRMHWRLWNGGTARVLLWGDPEYARRFVASTHLFDGDGFEVNEPLCTKMLAQPHDAQPFDLLTASHRYYQYEFERYWHFFQVFGRIGYNPEAAPEIWQWEFEKRFGREAAPFVEKALHHASWVLPRIVASCYPYSAFPMTRGWAEKQRLGDLPAYARAEGSDIQQFASFDEEARLLIEGGETAKIRPAENSRWLQNTAADILAQISEAEKRIGSQRSREFESTVADLRILANLALFHARRIPAAVSYRLYERTKNPERLKEAVSFEREATNAWRMIVNAAADFYADDLMMGVRGASLSGSWKDEFVALEKGLAALERQIQDSKTASPGPDAPQYRPAPADDSPTATLVRFHPVASAATGQPLLIAVDIRDPAGVKWVRLRYRAVNQKLDYQSLPMLPVGETDRYQAVIPPEEISSSWDLMYFIEVMDRRDRGRIYPDLNRDTPYLIVKLRR